MKKILFILFLLPSFALADDNETMMTPKVDFDTLDPLFFESSNQIISKTAVSIQSGNESRIRQDISYGLNGRLALNTNIIYQQDLDGKQDGFSGINLGAKYRASSKESKVITDLMFGFIFDGSNNVPEFINEKYYIGAKVGYKWGIMSLAGTVNTEWIFDDVYGNANIIFIPEVYIRVFQDWSIGGGFDFLKSTQPAFDESWVNAKIAKRYGHTMYIGRFDYEFIENEYKFSAQVNILF